MTNFIDKTIYGGANDDSILFQGRRDCKPITLKDFAAESFNVNGTKYKISDLKFVNK